MASNRLILDIRSALGGDNATPREWVIVARAGENPTTHGGFVLTESNAQAIIEHFDGRKNRAVIDYEHASLGGEYASPSGKAPAAGWVDRLVYHSDPKASPDGQTAGLWAHVEWTDAAFDEIATKAYGYLSPVIHIDPETREMTGFVNIALTNLPAMDDAPRVAAKEATMPDPQNKKNKKSQRVANAEGDDMPDDEAPASDAPSVDELISALGEALGSPDASPVEILIMAKGRIMEMAPPAAVEEAAQFKQALKASNAQIVALRNQIAELQDSETDRKFEAFLADAVKSGRVTEAELEQSRKAYRKLFEESPEDLAVMINSRPAIVAQGRTNAPKAASTSREAVILKAKAEFTDDLAKLTSLRASINDEFRSLGQSKLTDEEAAKHGVA